MDGTREERRRDSKTKERVRTKAPDYTEHEVYRSSNVYYVGSVMVDTKAFIVIGAYSFLIFYWIVNMSDGKGWEGR